MLSIFSCSAGHTLSSAVAMHLTSFRFELVIVWRIEIDEQGKVLPKLDLLTKVPLRALELDKNRVIETAPLSFRTLLGVLGIEATLESLIKSLCTEESS
ncbi:hypothetical protein FD754_012008 [Muntiacus muntjak]|uniref:Centromere protein P n=1 Tax=Muntiacus muntjak TaxID=9888 RepID=A0A5N3VD60_MUNMU|nr:hypothetical protein FD754_012008 [Muntiacus muntjak]